MLRLETEGTAQIDSVFRKRLELLENKGAGCSNSSDAFTRPEIPGTGVGLAIVMKAAERMRGSAGFESEAGKGSRFCSLGNHAQALRFLFPALGCNPVAPRYTFYVQRDEVGTSINEAII